MDEISLTGSVITILQSLEMNVGQPKKSPSPNLSTEKDHHEYTPTQEFEFTNKTSLTTKISTEKDHHENTQTQEFEFTNKTSLTTKISTEKDHHENTPTQEFEIKETLNISTVNVSSDTLNMNISKDVSSEESVDTSEIVSFPDSVSTTVPNKSKMQTLSDSKSEVPNKPATPNFTISQDGYIDSPLVMVPKIDTKLSVTSTGYLSDGVNSEFVTSFPSNHSSGYISPTHSKVSCSTFSQYISSESSTVSTSFDPTNKELSDSKSEVPNKPATPNFTMSQDGYIDSPFVMVPKIDTNLSVTSTGYLSDSVNSESVTSFPSNHSSGYISPTHSRVSYSAFSQYISSESSTVSTSFDPTNKELSNSKSEVPNKPATLNFTMSQDGYIDSPRVMVPNMDTRLSVTSTGYLSDGVNSESVTSFPSNHSSGYISPTHSRVSCSAFSQYISPESSTVSTPFDLTNKEGIDFTTVENQYRENKGCNWGSSDQIDFCDTIIGEDTEEMPHCTTFNTDIGTEFNNDYVDTNGKILLPRNRTNIRKESFDSLQFDDIDFV